MVDLGPVDIAGAIVAARPRIVVLGSPPGYGKLSTARALAAHIGPLHACTLPADTDALARAVLDGCVDSDASRATRFAIDRLAQGRRKNSGARARDALRREWPSAPADDVFLLHDPLGIVGTAAGADLCEELVSTLPSKRRLLIATRHALPPALSHIVTRKDTLLVGPDRLGLTEKAATALIRRAGLTPARASQVLAVAKGWPLVTRLLVEQLRTHAGEADLDFLSTLSGLAMLDFVAHRTIAGLAERVREALIVASFFPATRYLELVRILGPECDDAVFARMASLPFVDRSGESVIVHPETVRLLRERFVSTVEPLYERTLTVLARSGRHFPAARIALDAGDGLRAAGIIDSAPPFTAAPIPIGEYERVIERIDPGVITRFPNVWVATIPYRSFSIDPAAYIREAETVYFCLPPGADSDQRAAVLMLLASAYTNAGRAIEAETLLGEALVGFAAEQSRARASLLNFMASLRGIEGRFKEARLLADEAAGMSPDTFGKNQTLHYIEAHEAAYRGLQDRVIVILDELLQRRAGTEPPLYLAYVGMNGALFSWANGDDEAFERYQTRFEDATTPAIEAALGTLIDAARGRPARTPDESPWPLVSAVTHLYRMAAARDLAIAREEARAAARAADARGAPYTRTLAHIAVFVLDESTRDYESAVLQRIVSTIESPELRDAVGSVIRGLPAGMLEPYIRTRVLREHVEAPARIVVELLAGRVVRDGTDARLRGKEFELVALLASTRGSLSREEIGEALWEHLDDSEWGNNLKVTTYRVRKALASPEITVVEGGRHRLAPTVAVDLRDAEVLVRDATAPLDDATREALRTVIGSLRDGVVDHYERFGWSHTLVARLYDVACACGTMLADDAFARGRFDDALAYAARVRDIDELHEKACETTIRALVASGAADAARREFQRYAAALDRELATTPSAALADLVRSAV